MPRKARSFTQEEIDGGVVLNAAVILDDPRHIAEVTRAIEAKHLGLQVTGWLAAAGIIGQIIFGIGAILSVAMMIILLVALVIINNALLIATMDRVQEIGTMRAMGALRGFVLTMVVMETLVLSAFAGVGGTLLARIATALSAWKGIPSGGHDFLVLMFGGQRLFPVFDTVSAIVGAGGDRAGGSGVLGLPSPRCDPHPAGRGDAAARVT